MFAPFIVPSGIVAHLCGGSIIDEIHLRQLPSGEPLPKRLRRHK